jgi:putative molybdopterin biosynthesis protein
MQTTGSLEGLSRFAAGEAMMCGLHILDVDIGEYNIPAIKSTLQGRDAVVLEWAWREQGLIVAHGNPLKIHRLTDVVNRKAKLIDRQIGSGTKILLDYLLEKEVIKKEEISIADKPVRTEMDVGLTISTGKADVGIAVASVARQLHLDFIPLVKERFDLVMRRYDYFEPPIQKFLATVEAPAFI